MSKIQQVTTYQTTDGENFKAAREANVHQAGLDAQTNIAAFMSQAHPNSTGRALSRAVNLLTEWERWQRAQQPENEVPE